jgi:hypothetical protein
MYQKPQVTWRFASFAKLRIILFLMWTHRILFLSSIPCRAIHLSLPFQPKTGQTAKKWFEFQRFNEKTTISMLNLDFYSIWYNCDGICFIIYWVLCLMWDFKCVNWDLVKLTNPNIFHLDEIYTMQHIKTKKLASTTTFSHKNRPWWRLSKFEFW